MKTLIQKVSIALLTFAAMTANAQTSFFEPTDYVGALSSDPAKDWTKDWTNFDPFNTAYAAPTNTTLLDATTEASGRKEIPNNTTLDGVYLLKGVNYVADGSTLVIKPGTIIRAESDVASSNFACLIIDRGGKIIAEGTKAQPIVMTSNKAVGSRARGDWAGLFIAGRAPMNQTQTISGVTVSQRRMEGFDTRTQFDGLGFYGAGTSTGSAMDNSGILKYVRIEFAGLDLNTNQELNSLTLGAVGSGTTIDYVQCSFGNDDAFEWFGGTVNAKHIISFGTTDDDFDVDFGFTGKVQFAIAIRDRRYYDLTWNAPSGGSTSEGFESDNDANGTTAEPFTAPIFSNVSMFGPIPVGSSYADLTSTEQGAFRRGARLRRNSRTSILNSIFVGYRNYIMIDGNASLDAAGVRANPQTFEGELQFKNNLLIDVDKAFAGVSTVASGLAEVASGADVTLLNSWLLASANNNRTVSGTVFVNPLITAGSNIDFRPVAGSAATTGASFAFAKINNLTTTVLGSTAVLGSASISVTPNSLSNLSTTGVPFTVTASNLVNQNIIVEIPSTAVGFGFSPTPTGTYQQNWTLTGTFVSFPATVGGIAVSYSDISGSYKYSGELFANYVGTSTSSIVAIASFTSGSTSALIGLGNQAAPTVPSAIVTSIKSEGVKVYPNPSVDGSVSVVADINSTSSVVVYSLTGVSVASATITPADNKAIFSGLASGIYFVTVTSGSDVVVKKLVVE